MLFPARLREVAVSAFDGSAQRYDFICAKMGQVNHLTLTHGFSGLVNRKWSD